MIGFKKSEAQLLTWVLRVLGTAIVTYIAWNVYLAFLRTAIQNGVSPDNANVVALLAFIAILATWLGKLMFMVKIKS